MIEVIQKLLFTRFPYLFWFLRENENEVRIDFENNKLITSNDETFVLRPMSKIIYMCCKYLPVALIFAAIFNTNDLDFALKIKILEYGIGLILAVIVFFANRILIYLSFVAFLASGYFYIASVPFVLKYFFYSLPFLLPFSIKISVFFLLKGTIKSWHRSFWSKKNEKSSNTSNFGHLCLCGRYRR